MIAEESISWKELDVKPYTNFNWELILTTEIE